VGLQILEALRLHHSISYQNAVARCLALLEELGFEQVNKIFYSYPHQLSGGQKQRIMIAQAIVTRPKLLICDEPTTALDPAIQKSILDLLSVLCQKYNMAILLISHDLGVIYNYSHKLYVIDRGRILESGATSTIFSHPQNPVTQKMFHLLGWKAGLVSPPVFSLSGGRQNTEVILCKDVSFFYPQKRFFFEKKRERESRCILNNISFSLTSGQILGIIGESGSGKSTLAKVLLRLFPCNAGQIYWLGVNVTHLKEEKLKALRKNYQLIFQDPYASLNPYQRVREVLSEPLLYHRLAKSRKDALEAVIEILEKVGLNATFLDRYPAQLSGGQRQRICIARALLFNPKVLICDEAITALDIQMQKQILDLLLQIYQERELAIIFISHDFEIVQRFCRYVIVMHNGAIVETGIASQVLLQPQTLYTQNLIKAMLPTPFLSF
jgi:ABC-type glutathione transport system ATPase component